MKIIVGLGNPGERYCRNRHNIGFMVVDAIASKTQNSKIKSQNDKSKVKTDKLKLDFNKKLQAKIADSQLSTLNSQLLNVLLVKPQTFMNGSGKAVRRIVDYYKISKEEWRKSLFVIHDELDLPLGKLQIRRNIGPAGHKGIQSIIEALGTQDFVRFRVGVGTVEEPAPDSIFLDAELALRRTSETPADLSDMKIFPKNKPSTNVRSARSGLAQTDVASKNVPAAGSFKSGSQEKLSRKKPSKPAKKTIMLSKGVKNYLLSNFAKDEMVVVDKVVKQTAEAVLFAIRNGVERAMNRYN